MTDREAMKIAFDALEKYKKYITDDGAVPEHWDSYHPERYDALEVLRQALAKPEQELELCTCGEPHVLMVVHRKDAPCFIYGTNAWVGLTDADWDQLWQDFEDACDEFEIAYQEEAQKKHGEGHYYISPEDLWEYQKKILRDLIEAKLKEKNT